uniref:Uncharacterized protein n=1 Tax=Pinctada fucata TaxID=50426 RepID=A0A194AP02_PINFU
MANFQGKWVSDKSVPMTNFEVLMEKLGVDKALQQTFKEAVGTQTFSVSGNSITLVSTSSAFPGKERNKTFTCGETYDDVGIDGTPFKATTTMPNANTMVDEGTNEKYGDFKYTRAIEGNIMKCTTNMAGVTATYQMKRE